MRNAFADEITKLAEEDKRVFLLSGDIGNKLFDKYKDISPDRFLNCGVAEANMIGVAAGMAMDGLKPVAYTITPFITSRCFEQIRVDVCYHNVQVIIVGVGSGLSYSTLGPTHHSCEDIAILRSLPNLKIICPADAYEVRAALREAIRHDGPVYIRLGKKGEPLIHKSIPKFEIGKGIIIKEGTDVCLISTGNMLPIAQDVAQKLESNGLSIGIVSMHTIKPLDKELIRDLIFKYDIIVSIEEHSLIGGLGSAIAEWYTDNLNTKKITRLIRIGTKDAFMDITGEHEFARKYFEIDSDSIVKKILSYTERRTTTAAVLYEIGKPLEICELTIPKLQPGQVLVDIIYSGICHTQIGECRGKRGEDKYLPHCLGHEGSGIVREISEGITKFKVGDKVLISWMKGTGKDVPGCKYLNNEKEIDAEINAGGVTTFQNKAIISENRLTKINEDIPLEQAALLGCAVPTGLGSVLNVAKPQPKQSIAIFGTGGIGLCAIAGAKIAGCYPIIAVDINDSKLLIAKEMGATHFINPQRTNPIEEMKRICIKLDFAIESSGIPSVMDQALQSVRSQGGTIVVIGNVPFGQRWELNPWQLNQGKRILGTWGGDNIPERDFPRYMDLILSHEIDLKMLTTKIYSLSDINLAIDDLEKGKVARPLIDMRI